MRYTTIFLLITYSLVLSTLFGCEAFVKKFTRKPKHEEPVEEMVVVPQEYSSVFKDNAEAYRQYFLYWQSWQEELITAFLSRASQKRQLSCINEARKNLLSLKWLLQEQKQKELEGYIQELEDLRSNVEKDPYLNNTGVNRSAAELLKRNILKDFSYRNIKDYLK